MKIMMAALLFLIATAASAATASNDGSFASGGKTAKMKAVFAEKSASGTTFVVFTDKPALVKLEPKKFGDRDYLADVRCNIVGQGGKVATLMITKYMLFALATYDADWKLAQRVPGHPQMNVDAFNDSRVAGWIKATDADTGTSVDMSFAQPIHGGLHDLTPEENNILEDAERALNDAPPPPPPPPPPEPPQRKHR